MFFLLLGPVVSLTAGIGLLAYLSWRNQNSPLVKKGDAWKPPSRRARARSVVTLADFDPNAADAFPLADYAPGVIVRLPNSLAPILPLPQRARIVPFPIERVDNPLPPPPAPSHPPSAFVKPRLRVLSSGQESL